ncbi:DUF6807 family protein [Plantibacter sp. ME-Dv--P-122b]|uniref:DUF6807 family protein n=1 Tax=Plantibacter sp. ME-Dv--P-122b TaxID=3040300 RepID=UPI0025517C7B|nr:DUF6807 family protein [Plantibacter sp. ME-Dv--P-122b]
MTTSAPQHGTADRPHPDDGQPATRTPRIALVGVGGFGTVHLENLDRLQAAGRLELVAVADPFLPAPVWSHGEVVAFTDVDELLRATPDLDVVIVATPISSHAAIATAALEAGADVLLEKPPVASLAQFEELLLTADRTGGLVQVGFQSLGSAALDALAEDTVGLGPVGALSVVGLWSRPLRYWSRSPWAGRRRLDGEDVVDGVATNPLAHAIATALRIAGDGTRESVARVTTDLYRVNDIESDDTSVIRVELVDGVVITAALTLAAPEQLEPTVSVHGEHGTAVLEYTTDRMRIEGRVPASESDDESTSRVFDRIDLLEDLLASRAAGAPLRSSLASAGAFVEVLEAIRTAPDPTPIDGAFVEWVGEGAEASPVLADIAEWSARAVRAQATFSELGAPWAFPRADRVLAELRPGDGPVTGTLLDGRGSAPASSPRPHLHPLATLAGVTITDAHPADHDWHLGFGFTVQDVGGANLWGGGTFVRDLGYVLRPDHGRIETTALTARRDGFDTDRRWLGPAGATLLEERTSVRASRAPGDAVDTAWVLDVDLELRTPAGVGEVLLGSPATNGREGAGYGGFFLRLAACSDVRVRTADHVGEAATHGTSAPWIAWTGTFPGGPASLLLAGTDDATREDPWFVRVDGYPGIGSSIAVVRPTVVSEDRPLRRGLRIVVADGVLDDAALRAAGGIR